MNSASPLTFAFFSSPMKLVECLVLIHLSLTYGLKAWQLSWNSFISEGLYLIGRRQTFRNLFGLIPIQYFFLSINLVSELYCFLFCLYCFVWISFCLRFDWLHVSWLKNSTNEDMKFLICSLILWLFHNLVITYFTCFWWMSSVHFLIDWFHFWSITFLYEF